MPTKRIIPCLDVDKGKVVKGTNFKNIQEVADPVELAQKYVAAGADELVFYDITAYSEARTVFTDTIAAIAQVVDVPFTVGGGIRTLEDIELVLAAGADKVSINSAAIDNPQLIADAAARFGSEKIVLGIDVKEIKRDKWRIFNRGGQQDTGMDAIEWAKKIEALGGGEITVNSIDGDGVRTGYSIRLTRAIAEAVSIPIVASGGAGKMEDFLEAFEEGKASGALAASVFHFGEIDIAELKKFLDEQEQPLPFNPTQLRYDEKGLIPAIVQDIQTGEVLMLAYMNEEAVQKTIETKETWFYSRSRQEMWNKGATSGNRQLVQAMSYDCDSDAILVQVVPQGPACHTNASSCFFEEILPSTNAQNRAIISELVEQIAERAKEPVEGSYTTYLLTEGLDKVLKKIGEESSEVIIGAKNHDKKETTSELADLVYHALVLMQLAGISVEEIKQELRKRRSK